jgi:hypothetical protein
MSPNTQLSDAGRPAVARQYRRRFDRWFWQRALHFICIFVRHFSVSHVNKTDAPNKQASASYRAVANRSYDIFQLVHLVGF